MDIESKCILPYMFNLIIRLFDKKDLDSTALVLGLDMEVGDLARQDTLISFNDALHMIHNACEASADPGLGLAVAAEVNIVDWGMMGYAVASCASLGECLEIGHRYSRAATRLTDNILSIGPDVCTFQSTPLYEPAEQERFLIEEDLGGVVGMLHKYLGSSAVPQEVHFGYPAPGYRQRYRKHFQCPVLFDQPVSQIVWNTADMQSPNPLHNAAATQLAIQQCELLIANQQEPRTIVDQVKSRIIQNPGKFPSINEVAEFFSMSESSLRRSLKAQGTSYQGILNEVRKKLAIEYLTTSKLKLEDIAYLVGYNDLSNFRRAFRSWTGQPPREYRLGGGRLG